MIVSNRRTLEAMETQGLIILDGKPGETVKHWSGVRVPIITAHKGPKLENYYDHFMYKGEEYTLRYIEGCFSPFVVKVGIPFPPFA